MLTWTAETLPEPFRKCIIQKWVLGHTPSRFLEGALTYELDEEMF